MLIRERSHGLRTTIRAVAAAAVAVTLGACVSTLQSHPDYVVIAGGGGVGVKGQGVIVMDPELRQKTITAHPTSMTGSATSISLPIGQIIDDVAEKVLTPEFSEGVSTASAVKPDAYDVVLRLDGFSFKYDQLSNLGFAITPKVTVGLTIEALSPDGKRLFRKTYERKDYSSGSYVASLNPAERINRGVHQALGEIFREVADDVRNARRDA
jgi:hypothetical protein